MIDIYDEKGLLLPSQIRLLQSAAASALNSEGLAGSLDITVVERSSIRFLNLSNRGIDKETDVLSFPTVTTGQLPGDGFWGDVAICPEYVGEQAKLAGSALINELVLLVIHGVLHLIGHDHCAPKEEMRMFEAQRQILERVGVDYETNNS